jgi:hypothetical protein
MLPSQTAELVTRIASVDGRIVPASPDGLALACGFWHDTIGDLDYGDAYAVAVAHYREHSDRRLMPADVRAGVAEIRRARLATLPPVEELMADVPLDDPHYDGIRAARTLAAMEPPRTDRPALHA